jgi:hypothetical protein
VTRLLEQGLPTQRQGGRRVYPIVACRRWLAARRRAAEAARQGATTPRTRLDFARLRKAVALTALRERALETWTASVVQAPTHAAILGEHVAAVRLGMERAVEGWAPQFAGLATVGAASQLLERCREGLFAAGLAAGAAHVAQRRSPVAPAPGAEPPRTLAEARIRRWTAEAELIRGRIQLADGELVDVEAAIATYSRQLQNVRTSLLAIPGKLAPQCIKRTADEVLGLLRQAIADAFENVETAR